MSKNKTSGTKTRAKSQFRPDWQTPCENCGAKPTVPLTGLCGPCHFGKAATTGGGWWDESGDDFSDEAFD